MAASEVALPAQQRATVPLPFGEENAAIALCQGGTHSPKLSSPSVRHVWTYVCVH